MSSIMSSRMFFIQCSLTVVYDSLLYDEHQFIAIQTALQNLQYISLCMNWMLILRKTRKRFGLSTSLI